MTPAIALRKRSDCHLINYNGSPNTTLSPSIEVIHARDTMGTPSDFKASRPPSKVFSINAPIPTILEPEASGSRIVGIGALIEKTFEGGRDALKSLGVPIVSLACITSMDGDKVVFGEPL